jgi:hypothetical protein
MKHQVYMKRTNTSPWIKIDSFGDRPSADRLADRYRRDYPYAAIEVREE